MQSDDRRGCLRYAFLRFFRNADILPAMRFAKVGYSSLVAFMKSDTVVINYFVSINYLFEN